MHNLKILILKAIDYFNSLVSSSGLVVTVVKQVRFASDVSSSTIVNIIGIDKVLEEAVNKKEADVPRESIFCMAELWRVPPGSGQVDEPMTFEERYRANEI